MVYIVHVDGHYCKCWCIYITVSVDGRHYTVWVYMYGDNVLYTCTCNYVYITNYKQYRESLALSFQASCLLRVFWNFLSFWSWFSLPLSFVITYDEVIFSPLFSLFLLTWLIVTLTGVILLGGWEGGIGGGGEGEGVDRGGVGDGKR